MPARIRPGALLGPLTLSVLLAGCGAAGETVRPPVSTVSYLAAPPAVEHLAPGEPQASSASKPSAPSAPHARKAAAGSQAVPAPAIHQWPIPYGPTRKREMAAYSLRHYGEDSYVLSHPRVIVEHYTETATAREAFNTFAPDVPDSEFHELPNTCAHFLVEPKGRIDQLVPLRLRCRHTTGLNWTAIGIENVGFSDGAILGDRAQIAASLRLTRWLRCTYAIAISNVIGHSESLSSPYHRDRVPAFQHQTHADWQHADMLRYRAMLARLPCAPA